MSTGQETHSSGGNGNFQQKQMCCRLITTFFLENLQHKKMSKGGEELNGDFQKNRLVGMG